jgi:hypothetical protein
LKPVIAARSFLSVPLCTVIASAPSYPSPFGGRDERSSLFLIPPTSHRHCDALLLIPPTFVGSRRAKLAPSYPSHFCGEGGAKRRVGAAHVNARNTSPAAPTPTRRIVRSAHDAPPSPRRRGRDEDRRCRCTVRNDGVITYPFAAKTKHPHLRDLAAYTARVLHRVKPSEIQRAQGMPGARCTRSLACKIKKHTSKSPRSRRIHPAFPAQWC